MANKKTYAQSIDDLRLATHKAVDGVATWVGVPNDPDVRYYNNLSPADFLDLTKQFGFDAVTQYIQEMEGKRPQGR